MKILLRTDIPTKVQLRLRSCAMLFWAFTPPIALSIMHYSILAKSAHCTYFHVHSLASQESEKFHNLLQNLIISTNIRGTRQFRQSPLFSINKIDTRNWLAVVAVYLNIFSNSTTFIRNILLNLGKKMHIAHIFTCTAMCLTNLQNFISPVYHISYLYRH